MATKAATTHAWILKHAEDDGIHQPDTAAQVTIFRLRTGHCQLLSHLHRLKISHSDKCPCSTGPQTLNHILQSCHILMLSDARHGPVRWMPTGSFVDWLRHCSTLQTSPYSPDWTSSMARNAEEEEKTNYFVKVMMQESANAGKQHKRLQLDLLKSCVQPISLRTPRSLVGKTLWENELNILCLVVQCDLSCCQC